MVSSQFLKFVMILGDPLVGQGDVNNTSAQWRSLIISTGGSEVTGPKSIYLKKLFFYKTGWSKTYIHKKFYMKHTSITLLNEKFGGSDTPSGPFTVAPLDLLVELVELLGPPPRPARRVCRVGHRTGAKVS
ncbi:hypothetical protein Hanom_Chr15g01361361 [Helianthus anomalus]